MHAMAHALLSPSNFKSFLKERKHNQMKFFLTPHVHISPSLLFFLFSLSVVATGGIVGTGLSQAEGYAGQAVNAAGDYANNVAGAAQPYAAAGAAAAGEYAGQAAAAGSEAANAAGEYAGAAAGYANNVAGAAGNLAEAAQPYAAAAGDAVGGFVANQAGALAGSAEAQAAAGYAGAAGGFVANQAGALAGSAEAQAAAGAVSGAVDAVKGLDMGDMQNAMAGAAPLVQGALGAAAFEGASALAGVQVGIFLCPPFPSCLFKLFDCLTPCCIFDPILYGIFFPSCVDCLQTASRQRPP